MSNPVALPALTQAPGQPLCASFPAIRRAAAGQARQSLPCRAVAARQILPRPIFAWQKSAASPLARFVLSTATRHRRRRSTMSLLGAMGTAISGLTAQSAAFSNISDDIANSQTTGFKRVDTNFSDYITNSTASDNESDTVVATPAYINTVQGAVTQTDNPLALAISGQGFFAVSTPTNTESTTDASSSTPTFSTEQSYTRDGNFQLDKNGYLVNDQGSYLNGWSVAPDGTVDTNTLAPIQVSQAVYQPVATSNIALSANLPATYASTDAAITSNVTVYDAEGNAHQLTLTFQDQGADPTTTSDNDWTVSIADDEGNTVGTADLMFAPNGTLATVTQPSATITPFTNAAGTSQASAVEQAAGSAATLTFPTNYATSSGGYQNLTLNLGTIGGSSGLTQFAGTTYTLGGLTQNGVPPGQFSSLTMETNGDVVANYNNGQTQTIAQVPVVTFPAPDALQLQDGSSFTATQGSGAALAKAAGSSGAGSLVTSSVEASNVDIATEFSNLIVAQQAYSANAKTVTTANDMMSTALNMMR
jgi:flagellar hook protein FlgE